MIMLAGTAVIPWKRKRLAAGCLVNMPSLNRDRARSNIDYQGATMINGYRQ
jgi:hypothetical protein